MANILMLALANVRKGISQAATLLLYVLMAAMLLNTGLVLSLRLGSLFDERAEANHMAHYAAVYMGGAESAAQGLRFMQAHPDVVEAEAISAVGGLGSFYLDGVKTTAPLILSRVDAAQKMDAPSLVGESLPLAEDAIYVSWAIQLSGGYQIGDEFRIVLSGAELSFVIAGATEEMMFASTMTTSPRFYVSAEKYEELRERFPDCEVTLLSARLADADDAVFFKAEFRQEVSSEGLIGDFSYDDAKGLRIMVPAIIAAIVALFALILLAVSLIVMRFRIVGSIEEDMGNIGALKGIGYVNAQVIASFLLQFTMTALLGSLLGVALSQAVIPIIMSVIEPQLGLVWDRPFDAPLALTSIALVVVATALIAYLAARRVSRLDPLVALRGGLATHSFNKNPLPLEGSPGPLSLLLASKQLLQNKRQAATVAAVVAVVSMASIVGLALNYNMNINRDSFTVIIGGEMPDVQFVLHDDSDSEGFKRRMSEDPRVRKVQGYTIMGTQALVDGNHISVVIVEDTSLLESQMMVSGRYPRFDNEIALGVTAARLTGKDSGDVVTVKVGTSQREYYVTGVIQTVEGMLTADAMRRLQPDYEFVEISVYLHEGVDAVEFIASVQAAELILFDDVVDIKELQKASLDSMGGMFAAVAVGIMAVTVFVVALTLYMVVKAAIIRRRHELGILKAFGFTTAQLMNQIALSMAPTVLCGVAAGALAGYLLFNPMMGMMLGGLGVAQVDLPVPLAQIAAACLALVVLAYGISMAIAFRIRKISAYSLVT